MLYYICCVIAVIKVARRVYKLIKALNWLLDHYRSFVERLFFK